MSLANLAVIEAPVEFVTSGGQSYSTKVLAVSPAVEAYWQLNEQSGTGVVDSSGNGHAGVASGVTWQVPGIGDDQTAAGLDGLNDYINVLSAGLISAWNADEGTFSWWVWHDSTGAGSYRSPFEWNADGNNRYTMYGQPVSGMSAIFRRGATHNSTGDGAQPLDQWYHQAIKWSVAGNYLRMYRNGSLVGSPVALNGTWVGSLAVARLGSANGTFFIKGRMAHFAWWTSPLTDDQIASLAEV